ncbi:hypothetical protein ACFL6D_02265 [Spirochaetota bacterium]
MQRKYLITVITIISLLLSAAVMFSTTGCLKQNNPLSPSSEFFNSTFRALFAKPKYVFYENNGIRKVNTDGTGAEVIVDTNTFNIDFGNYQITYDEQYVYFKGHYRTNTNHFFYSIYKANIQDKTFEEVIPLLFDTSGNIFYQYSLKGVFGNNNNLLIKKDNNVDKTYEYWVYSSSGIEDGLVAIKDYTNNNISFDSFTVSLDGKAIYCLSTETRDDGSGTINEYAFMKYDVKEKIATNIYSYEFHDTYTIKMCLSPEGDTIFYLFRKSGDPAYRAFTLSTVPESQPVSVGPITLVSGEFLNSFFWSPYQNPFYNIETISLENKYGYISVTEGSMTELRTIQPNEWGIARDAFGYWYLISTNESDPGTPEKLQ